MSKYSGICIGQMLLLETLIFNHIEAQGKIIFIHESKNLGIYVDFEKSEQQQKIDLQIIYEKLSTTRTPFVITPLVFERFEEITLKTEPQQTLWKQHAVAPYDDQCKKKPTPKARSDIIVLVLFLFPHKTKWPALACRPFFYFTTTFFGFFTSLRCRSFPFAICVMIIF